MWLGCYSILKQLERAMGPIEVIRLQQVVECILPVAACLPSFVGVAPVSIATRGFSLFVSFWREVHHPLGGLCWYDSACLVICKLLITHLPCPSPLSLLKWLLWFFCLLFVMSVCLSVLLRNGPQGKRGCAETSNKPALYQIRANETRISRRVVQVWLRFCLPAWLLLLTMSSWLHRSRLVQSSSTHTFGEWVLLAWASLSWHGWHLAPPPIRMPAFMCVCVCVCVSCSFILKVPFENTPGSGIVYVWIGRCVHVCVFMCMCPCMAWQTKCPVMYLSLHVV